MGFLDRFKKKRETYEEIDEFIENIDFPNVKNADILLEHARKNFEVAKDSVEYIEKKADDLIKYLGLGTGLVGILLNYSFTSFDLANKFIILAGYVFWIFSIILSLTIRRPSSYPYPVPLDKAFYFMQKFSSEPQALKAWISLAYEKTMKGYIVIIEKKAKRLDIAYILLVAALWLFFVSFLLRFILSLS